MVEKFPNQKENCCKTKFNPEKHHRRSIRLKGYDYSQPGAYFITICTKNRKCLFGNIINGKMILNDAGHIAQNCWLEIPNHYSNVILDEFVIMPNHIHGIIIINVGANNNSPRLYDLSDANFLIELDRKNGNDCVFYNDEPERFIRYIEMFGFERSIGSRSDIQVLGDAWNLCSTNLSVGYYNAHTPNEYLVVNELLSTIEKVVRILKVNKRNPRRFRLK